MTPINPSGNPSGDPSGIPGVDPIRKAGTAAGEAAQTGRLDGPAFHVLLERLQTRARELEATSRDLEGSDALAEAVDAARASLDDASSLGDRLLEAFRGEQHRRDVSGGER